MARTMMPDRDWTWLRDIKTRLYSVAPRRSSTRPVITSVQLADLGEELMEESKIDGHETFSLDDAVRYRDGLMIALLAHVPLRHKNFSALQIGRDVIKEDGKWSIVIPPEETKTRTYIDFQIPEDLQHQFLMYLTHVRPRMLRLPGCKALWVSAKGGALSYSAVGPVLTGTLPSASAFGLPPMTPATLQRRRGLSQRLSRSGSRVTCSYTAICGQPSSTTIARKVSRLGRVDKPIDAKIAN